MPNETPKIDNTPRPTQVDVVKAPEMIWVQNSRHYETPPQPTVQTEPPPALQATQAD